MVEQRNNFPYAVDAFPGVGILGLGERLHLNQTGFNMVQAGVLLFKLK